MLINADGLCEHAQTITTRGTGGWSHRIEVKVVRNSSLLLALAAAWAVFFTVGEGSTPQNANITTIYDLWDSVSHDQA